MTADDLREEIELNDSDLDTLMNALRGDIGCAEDCTTAEELVLNLEAIRDNAAKLGRAAAKLLKAAQKAQTAAPVVA